VNIMACLCGCGRAAYSRGLAATCYSRTHKRIKAGITTEAAEMAAGRMAANRTAEALAMLKARQRKAVTSCKARGTSGVPISDFPTT